MRDCNSCKFCILSDYGYSNWTVEGTSADCLKDLNPGFPKDRFYGEAPAMKFGETCPGYSGGDPVEVDVEQELGELANYSDDPEVKEILARM